MTINSSFSQRYLEFDNLVVAKANVSRLKFYSILENTDWEDMIDEERRAAIGQTVLKLLNQKNSIPLSGGNSWIESNDARSLHYEFILELTARGKVYGTVRKTTLHYALIEYYAAVLMRRMFLQSAAISLSNRVNDFL